MKNEKRKKRGEITQKVTDGLHVGGVGVGAKTGVRETIAIA